MNATSSLRRIMNASAWSGLLLATLLTVSPPVYAQAVQWIPTIVRVAGTAPNPNPVPGPAGNGPAISATLNSPQGIAIDKGGNLYIVDAQNDVVRKVDTAGDISTFAGGGSGTCTNATDVYGDGCPVADSLFSTVSQGGLARVAIDATGSVYISDFGACMVHRVDSTTGVMTAYAGTTLGCTGVSVDGPVATAQLGGPAGLAFDPSGNLFIADFTTGKIRKVAAGDATVITVAGGGSGTCTGATDSGGDGCPATAATFAGITDVATDANGNLYISDQDNFVIRRITVSSGIITVFAGTFGTSGSSGNGGAATSALLSFPKGVIVDGVGNVYIADRGNNVVRKVDTSGTISASAGIINSGGGYAGDNNIATNATLNYPLGLALNPAGDLFVSEYANDVVRRVDLSGTASFLPVAVGQTGSALNVAVQVPSGTAPPIAPAAGFTDFTVGAANCAGAICTAAVTFSPHAPGLRKTPLQVTSSGTIYSFGLLGTGNGPAVALTPGVITTDIAALQLPTAIAADSAGNLYIADDSQNTVVKVSPSGTRTSITSGLNAAQGITVDGLGNVYIANTGGGTVLKIAANNGGTATLAGGLTTPSGIAVDTSGNVYLSETSAGNIVEIPTNGGPLIPIATGLSSPAGIAVDGNGNLFVAEQGANTVDEISAVSGEVVDLSISGLTQPNSIALDAAGNLYLSETATEQVVRVDIATNAVTIVAGNGSTGFTGNAGAATLATLDQPLGVAVDSSGNLYIADSGNQAIRKVTVSPAATLNFEPTTIGTTSSDSPQSARITNIGNQSLTITALAATTNFAIAGNVTNGCTTSTPVGVGSSCVVGVNFTPTTTGDLSGTDTITDDALNVSGVAQTIPLNGTGLLPATQLVFAPPPSSPIANGANLGTVTVDVEDSTAAIVINSSASVTLTVAGPSGFITQTSTENAVGGVATFSLSEPLTIPGTYTVTASSSGLTSATATVTVSAVVVPPTFSVTVSPTTVNASVTSAGTAVVTVAGQNNFSGSVALSCLSLPAGVTCTFSPASVTLTGVTTTVTSQLTISATALAVNSLPGQGQNSSGMLMATIFWLPGILLGCLLAFERKKLKAGMRPAWMLAIAVASMAGMLGGLTGCGNHQVAPSPSTSQISIVGTAAGGQTQSAQLTLVVYR